MRSKGSIRRSSRAPVIRWRPCWRACCIAKLVCCGPLRSSAKPIKTPNDQWPISLESRQRSAAAMQTQQPRLVLCRSNGRGTSQCDCWTSSIKREVDVSLERAVLDLAQRFESVELPPVRGLIDVLSHARGDAALFHLNEECQVAISGLLSVFEL